MSLLPEPTVWRHVDIPVSCFDWLKQFQRGFEARKGIRVTNSQILAVILREHRDYTIEASKARPALFRPQVREDSRGVPGPVRSNPEGSSGSANADGGAE